MHFLIARTDEELLRCFPVAVQLRPHLSEADFVERVRRQEREGYQMAYLEIDGAVQAVAGFRLMHTLFCDRLMHVDDLVTDETRRSQGCGTAFLHWLARHAEANGCTELHLDSALHRQEAHRFYYKNGMPITEFHFEMKLNPAACDA